MTHTANFSFVVPSATRSYGDDDWRITDAKYIEAWKEAIEQLAKRKVVARNISYDVAIDWTPMLRRYEQHFSAMSEAFDVAPHYAATTEILPVPRERAFLITISTS